MIKFLVTAAIVLVCLFVLVLMCCLMVWVVARLLRFLFPQRFGGKTMPKVKKSTSTLATLVGDVWDIMTANPLLTVFICAALVSLGFSIFRRAKRAARG